MGDKLSLTIIPKSRVCVNTLDEQLSRNRRGAVISVPMFKTQHLSTDIPSCHSCAQLVQLKAFIASCSCCMYVHIIYNFKTHFYVMMFLENSINNVVIAIYKWNAFGTHFFFGEDLLFLPIKPTYKLWRWMCFCVFIGHASKCRTLERSTGSLDGRWKTVRNICLSS